MSGPREFGEYEADKAASSGPSERETARDWDFENKADEEQQMVDEANERDES